MSLLPADYRGALPRPTPETQPFWDGTKAHKLMLPWCVECGKPHFYPRSLCPFCLSDRIDWRQASGKATLHTYVINHKAAKGFDQVPYVIAVAQLEEGPRMLTNLVTDAPPEPAMLAVDMPIEVTFKDVTETITLPQFRLAKGVH